MTSLVLLAQAAPPPVGALVIPAWAVGVLVTLVTVVLGFAWRLAARAERSADLLDAATQRLTALETRIAFVAALETQLAVLRAELTALDRRVNGIADDVRHSHPSRP